MDPKSIDLTLRLGPPSPDEQNKQNQDPPVMENENGELNNPPPPTFMIYPEQDPPVMGIENFDLNSPPPPDFGFNPQEDVGIHIPRKVCRRCGSHNTPLWRKGPGRQTLCNACGLRRVRVMRRRAV